MSNKSTRSITKSQECVLSQSETEEVVRSVVSRGKQKMTFGSENIKAGDNSRYLRHALVLLDLPPIDISDDKQVNERIAWYFNHCADNDMKPTVTGLANSLGVSRFTLYEWRTGKRRGLTDNRPEIIQRAYSVLEELWEDYMLNGKINPVSGIFIGLNHFGYTNKQEIVVTPNNPLGEKEDMNEIRQRYLESIPEDE